VAVAKVVEGANCVEGGAAISPRGGKAKYLFTPEMAQTYGSGAALGHHQVVNGRYLVHAPFPANPNERNSVTNGEASVYLGRSGSNRRHALYQVGWGYNGTPSGAGAFRVESPSGTIVYGPVPVTSAGAGEFSWPDGLLLGEDSDALVVLAAGGGGVTGRVSIGSRGIRG
jgi:hypothetical protein